VDYDVAFTGDIGNMLKVTQNDDSDFLTVSCIFSNTTDIELINEKEKEATASEKDWYWYMNSKMWLGKRKFIRSYTSTMRLSRRMMLWCLEAMFTPTIWTIDEVFYRTICDSKPDCKYRPLQTFTINKQSVLTSETYTYRFNQNEYFENLKKGIATNQLWHSIKHPTLNKREYWLQELTPLLGNCSGK